MMHTPRILLFALPILVLAGCAVPKASAPVVPDTATQATAEACVSTEDCKTPMEYMLRSNCPFSSRCIAGACAVVCPMWSPDTGSVTCQKDADCDCSTYAGDDIVDCKCVESACVAIVGTIKGYR